MAIQRLDLRTVRYDKFARAVLFDGRGGTTVEVSQEALEAQFRRGLEPDEAVASAVEIVRHLTQLATLLPADDGRIHITRAVLMGEGLYGEAMPRMDDKDEEEE